MKIEPDASGGYRATQRAYSARYEHEEVQEGWGETRAEAIQSCFIRLARYNGLRWPVIDSHEWRHGCMSSCTLDHSDHLCDAYLPEAGYMQCLVPRDAHKHAQPVRHE